MAQEPISPDLMKSYRDTLKIASAPSFIDTSLPIMPVAVVAQTSTAEVAQYMRVTDGTDTLTINTDGSINVSGLTMKTISQSGGTNIVFPNAGTYWIVTCAWAWNDGTASNIDFYKGVHVATGSEKQGNLSDSAVSSLPLKQDTYIASADCLRLVNNVGITYYEGTE